MAAAAWPPNRTQGFVSISTSSLPGEGEAYTWFHPSVRSGRGQVHPTQSRIVFLSFDSVAGPKVERRTDFRCPRNDVHATKKVVKVGKAMAD